MDKSEPHQLEKLNFKFIFDDDYNPKYINGAYGGVTPQGDIILHFYHERPAIPNKMVFKLDSKGALQEEILHEREPDDHQHSFVRFVQGGVTMSYSTAKRIQKLLNDKIADLEKHIENDGE